MAEKSRVGRLVRNDGRGLPLDLEEMLAIISSLKASGKVADKMIARKIEDFYGI